MRRAGIIAALVFSLCLATSHTALASEGPLPAVTPQAQMRALMALTETRHGPLAHAAGIGVHCGLSRCSLVWSRRSTYRLQQHVAVAGGVVALPGVLCGSLPGGWKAACAALVAVNAFWIADKINNAARRYKCFALGHDHVEVFVYPYIEHGGWCHTK